LSLSHIYFTAQEQAIFRNMIAHYSIMKANEEDFVKLFESVA
jgi:hypothetical protein